MTNTAALALTVGAPDVAGPLTVFPVFGPEPRLQYRSFAEAAEHGATVQELDGKASVNDLIVRNPLDVGILLYEGEELRGAQQDRTVDASVLVPAGATLRVSVSCVEHGRWDESRHGEEFSPAPTAAFPQLRRAKNRALRASAALRANQDEVWNVVGERARDTSAHAPTSAMRDVFEAQSEPVADMRSGITRRDGQVGAVAVIRGRICVADVIGRSDVFAALHGPLVSGYALDALMPGRSSGDGDPDETAIQAFLDAALTLPDQPADSLMPRETTGLGRLHVYSGPEAEGTRLVHQDELVALTAFPGDKRRARIARPSERRA